MRSLTDGLEDSSTPSDAAKSSAGLREKLNDALAGPVGKIFLVLVALSMVVFFIVRFQGAAGPPPETIVEPRVRVLNPLSGEMAWHKVKIGVQVREGFYPVEYCWNDHNGDGVPVVLNNQLFDLNDPRREEPTLCPCCGAVVVPRNPKPEEFLGQTPTDYESGQADPCVVEHYTELLGG